MKKAMFILVIFAAGFFTGMAVEYRRRDSLSGRVDEFIMDVEQEAHRRFEEKQKRERIKKIEDDAKYFQEKWKDGVPSANSK